MCIFLQMNLWHVEVCNFLAFVLYFVYLIIAKFFSVVGMQKTSVLAGENNCLFATNGSPRYATFADIDMINF